MAPLSGHLAPDFVGIGPARTGTTWLHQLLANRAWMPCDFKETDFFSRNHGRGFDWYDHQFRHCDATRPIGEFSPSYFAHAESDRRLHEVNPQCRIICTLRDPVDRAYSHYKLLRRAQWTKLDLEECVAQHAQIRGESRYAFHLRRWLARFGDECVSVFFYDDLRADQQVFADSVCDFIGVARIDVQAIALPRAARNTIERAPKNPKLAQNARHFRQWLREHDAFSMIRMLERLGVWRWCFGRGEEFAPLSPEVDARLRALFRPEVEALEEIVGRDLTSWKFGRSAAREANQAIAPVNAARLRA